MTNANTESRKGVGLVIFRAIVSQNHATKPLHDSINHCNAHLFLFACKINLGDTFGAGALLPFSMTPPQVRTQSSPERKLFPLPPHPEYLIRKGVSY